jgi:hypothetical protein
MRLVERHPGCAFGDATAEDYAELVEMANRGPGRRSQMMISAYASFLGGAIAAAGSLADAELAGEEVRDVRASQAHAALCNTLGGLLAYARLLSRDVARLMG